MVPDLFSLRGAVCPAAFPAVQAGHTEIDLAGNLAIDHALGRFALDYRAQLLRDIQRNLGGYRGAHRYGRFVDVVFLSQLECDSASTGLRPRRSRGFATST